VLEPLSGQSGKKLIFPSGKVERSNCAAVITGGGGSTTVRRYWAYDVHPRLDWLVASSVASRLHLACLFTASGTALQDRRHGLTGAEVAMELVRQSWVNRPLTPDEQTPLDCLKGLAVGHPGLALLAHELDCSSRQLSFLYPGKVPPIPEPQEVPPVPEPPEVDPSKLPLVTTAYLNEPLPRNPRQALTTEEEERLLPVKRDPDRSWSSRVPDFSPTAECSAVATQGQALVGEIEAELQALVGFRRAFDVDPPFPLPIEPNLESTPLGKRVVEDERASWDAFVGLSIRTPYLKDGTQAAGVELVGITSRVNLKRKQIEECLVKTIKRLPEECGHARAFKLYRLAGVTPQTGRLIQG
jgi:hypothetical protein